MGLRDRVWRWRGGGSSVVDCVLHSSIVPGAIKRSHGLQRTFDSARACLHAEGLGAPESARGGRAAKTLRREDPRVARGGKGVCARGVGGNEVGQGAWGGVGGGGGATQMAISNTLETNGEHARLNRGRAGA